MQSEDTFTKAWIAGYVGIQCEGRYYELQIL
jgi:hypothetical protein